MSNPFKSLRDLFERLAFAGLKPDAPAGPKKSKLESLIHSAEDLASRGLKADETPLPGPTTRRKRILIGVALLGALGVVVALVIVLQKPAHRAEIEAASGPPVQIVKPGVIVEKNKDLAVDEFDFNKLKQPKEIIGTLHNLTDQRFATCEVSFDVTTKSGAQLGGVATTVHDIAPHGTVQFRIPVPQQEASFAMVRELRHE